MKKILSTVLMLMMLGSLAMADMKVVSTYKIIHSQKLMNGKIHLLVSYSDTAGKKYVVGFDMNASDASNDDKVTAAVNAAVNVPLKLSKLKSIKRTIIKTKN